MSCQALPLILNQALLRKGSGFIVLAQQCHHEGLQEVASMGLQMYNRLKTLSEPILTCCSQEQAETERIANLTETTRLLFYLLQKCCC